MNPYSWNRFSVRTSGKLNANILVQVCGLKHLECPMSICEDEIPAHFNEDETLQVMVMQINACM